MKSNTSRRKFLTTIGLAAGAAAAIPAVKSIEAMRGNKVKMASAKENSKHVVPFLAQFKPFKAIGMISRTAGTCRLSLAGRPA